MDPYDESEEDELPLDDPPAYSIEAITVLVTGATGYIATHIVQQLLRRGYRVRGTVRDLKNEVKVKPLRLLCPGSVHPLELVEADLNDTECWERAVAGCYYVIHTASPFLASTPKDPERELLRPAVDGTMSVLQACHRHRVRRVVLTSSMAAISGFGDPKQPNKVYTEEDWTDISNKDLDPYLKSKTLAERAAWDFVNTLPDEEKFELAVIHPSYVMGPVLCGGEATSMEVPRQLMQREMPLVPRIYFVCCDVRDVATAHVNAMTFSGAAGHRHIITSGSLWMSDIAEIIRQEFRPQGFRVPTKVSPNAMVSFLGLFDKTTKMIVPFLGKTHELDNTRMKDVLGIEGYDLKDTILDMCYSMLDRGFITRRSKSKHKRKPKRT